MNLNLIKIFFGFIFSCYLISQQPFIRQISYREGLPTQTIYDLFSNNIGILYLGTDKGLMSFDGIKFITYPYEASLAISVNSIQQDSNGTIWCKNFANEIFYLKNEKLYQKSIIKQVLLKDQSNLIDYLVYKNQFWIITEKNVYLSINDGAFKKVLSIKKDDITNSFTSITSNSTNEDVYVLSFDYVYKFSNQKLQKITKVIDSQKEALVYKNQLFYCAKGKINELHTLESKVKDDNLPNNTYFNNLSLADDQLWLSASNGLYVYNDIENTIKLKYLENKYVTDVVFDKEGNYWISTLNEGLFMIPDKQIYTFKLNNFSENTSYTSIYKNDHYLYIGTSQGNLVALDQELNILNQRNFKTSANVEFIKSINNNIFCTYGAFSDDLRQNLIDDYVGKDIAKIEEGYYLVSSYNMAGLYIDTLSHYQTYHQLKQKLNSSSYHKNFKFLELRKKRSRSLHYDLSQKTAYIGYSDGLYFYDNQYNAREIQFNKQPIIAAQIIKDKNSQLWIATSQNGLLCMKDNQVIKQYSLKDGLSSNQCLRIESQNDGIWILTSNGMNFLSFVDYKVKNLNQNLNFAGIHINDFKKHNTQLWFATNQGIFYFDESLLKKTIRPYFSFKKIVANNKTLSKNNVNLKYNENNIEFTLQGIHFKSLGDFSYKYRLLPVDTTWQSQKAINNNIRYLSLNPGKYQLQAKLDFKEGTSNILEYNFNILKPFWLRNWFLILMSLLLLSVFYLVYKLASIRVQKQQALKEQLALSQLTALRSQMNPHFLFNILQAVQGLIYSNQKSKASEYLGTFSDLIRKTLDISDKVSIKLSDELEAINLYVSLEKSRFETDDFNYKIQVNAAIDTNTIMIPSLIIQPFVENAIKHGLMHKVGTKNLLMKIDVNEDYLLFDIEDNGIGREHSSKLNNVLKKHTSFATKAIKNRIELLNKMSTKPITFETVDKANNKGTIVLIKIPIITIHESNNS